MVIDVILNPVVNLILGTLLGGWLERRLYRPKLRIQLSSNSKMHADGRYLLSLRVKNIGRTAARECIGAISIHDLIGADIISQKDITWREYIPKNSKDVNQPNPQAVSHDNFREIDSEVICWGEFGNPAAKTINPGLSALLDFMMAARNPTDGSWYLIFPSELGWSTLRVRLKDRNYHGTVTVSPSNGRPEIRFFTIRKTVDELEGPTLELLPRSKLARVPGALSK